MIISLDKSSINIIDRANLNYIVKLPEMSDKQYDKIKYIMEYAGGHWRERFGGFQFNEAPDIIQSRLADIISSGEINLSNDMVMQIKYQFYPTPDRLAQQMVEMADIKPGEAVLEPSAGRGAILKYIASKTPNYKAVELNADNANYLRGLGYNVSQTSFELFSSRTKMRFDKVVMNPPFSDKRDILHTMMAYNLLKPGGTLVGLLAENSIYYKREITARFNRFIGKAGAKIHQIPHGTFAESGTNVDVVCIVLHRTSTEKMDLLNKTYK